MTGANKRPGVRLAFRRSTQDKSEKEGHDGNRGEQGSGCALGGEFMGVAPTGRQVTMSGNTIACIEAGRIVEESTEMDTVGLMQQIGAMP